MLINQHSYYNLSYETSILCLFGYQKATNRLVIIFNMIDRDISYYQVSDKLNNSVNNLR